MNSLERAQNRLTLYMAAGFATGFVIGFLAAWMLK